MLKNKNSRSSSENTFVVLIKKSVKAAVGQVWLIIIIIIATPFL